MVTDVEITVSGAPFTGTAVNGVTINHGYDMIPTALLDLDASTLQKEGNFLCNPDKYKTRDKLITIEVRTKTGCTKFRGFFDGLSIQQSPGGFTYTAVIKNQFQRLLEIFPRFVGVYPGSFQIFRALEQFHCKQGDPTNLISAFKISNDISISLNLSIGEFAVAYFKNMVTSQFNYAALMNEPGDAQEIFDLMNSEIYKANIAAAIPLFTKIDTSYVKPCQLLASKCAKSIAALTLGDHENLWDVMRKVFNYMGCTMLISDEALYIVPQANFLKMNHSTPSFQKAGTEPNTANPIDYSNFNMSDNGFVNIKHCYVAIDPATMPSIPDTKYTPAITQCLGVYPRKGQEDPEIPDDGSSGILIVTAPALFCNSLQYGLVSNPKTHSDLQSGGPYSNQPVKDPKTVSASIKEINTLIVTQLAQDKLLLDQFAKIKFLQAKYTDRCGSFTLIFNPNWVPATTGSLYTRTPGIFAQFYVTSVTHHIKLAAPNSGYAVTNVNFNSARLGPEGQIPGVNSADLFQYTTGQMLALQHNWIVDQAQ